MKPTRILLVEDHALVRSGFRALLEGFEGIVVVGEAADGREALALVAARRPDVVLMDLTMPELNGLEATARISRQFPDVRVLILSMHRDEQYVAHALRAGAAGYLLKDASSSELELAVRAAARGETYLSPAVAKPVVEDYLAADAAHASAFDRLTPRQREVLQLIAEGHTTKRIAARLGVSIKTAEAHRAELMARLDIHDVAGLVRYAVRLGLVGTR